MGKYIKCPRCELNWILEENEYCDVCKAELGVKGFTLLEDEDEDMLCPVCGVNYIEHGERMCSECRSKQKDDVNFESDTSSSDEEHSDVEVISFDELEQEETDDKFDIYDDSFDDPDGFADSDFDNEEEENEDEDDESVSNEDDDFENDFNYDIDGVDTSDLDDEEDEDEDEDI
ncbi:MAG: hypothetical protein K2J89_00600 [Clostridia bacterium]|nr:hypothetical protein [Clostridia bacterium]